MVFHKAALVIVSCELALQSLFKSRHEFDDLARPEDIYTIMRIIPACWSIDSFTANYLSRAAESFSDAIPVLREAAGQDNNTVIEDLAGGYTVTWHTANSIKHTIDTHDGFTEPVDVVRARPGRGKLGNKKASQSELVDVG